MDVLFLRYVYRRTGTITSTDKHATLMTMSSVTQLIKGNKAKNSNTVDQSLTFML